MAAAEKSETLPERQGDPENPKVGDAATFTVFTDSHACTVISVSRSGKSAVLRTDKATLLNGVESGEPDAMTFSPGGFAGHWHGRQRYAYEPDPNGRLFRVSKRTLKNGKPVWKQTGHRTQSPGCYVTFGVRAHHHDFNY